MVSFEDQLATVLTGTTALPAAEVADRARHAAEGLTAENISLTVDGDDDVIVGLMVPRFGRVHGRRPLGAFSVEIDAAGRGDGRSRVSVALLPQEVQVEQAKLLHIPISPKKILGYKLYSKFLAAFSEALTATDPSAALSIQVGETTA